LNIIFFFDYITRSVWSTIIRFSEYTQKHRIVIIILVNKSISIERVSFLIFFLTVKGRVTRRI